ncbi:MAG: hypothetical protein ABSB42_08295 [Tepidisphaeraceae bacterium]|jgi:hypothetical protein
MNCTECREHLAELFETPNDGVVVSEHLAQCPACREEAEHARALHARLTSRAAQAVASPNFTEATLRACRDTLPSVKSSGLRTWNSLWRWGLAAAAMVGIVFLFLYTQSPRQASAEDVLKSGSAALQDIHALHIQARMRAVNTTDNPGAIDLTQDFTPIEIWTRTQPGKKMEWRVEKPQRIMVMDGRATYIYIPTVQLAAEMGPMSPKQSGDLNWLSGLLEPREVLENELKNAQSNAADVKLTQETVDGREFSVVTVESKAQVKSEGDEWLKNKLIWTSDTRRIYRFDAQTSRLEGLQIFVHAEPGNDVLVFETTLVEYPDTLADTLFSIDLPQGLQWQDMRKAPTAKDIPPTCAPSKKPEEVAQSFFKALSTGNPDAVQPYMMIKMKFPDEVFAAFKDLQIVSIGKPFHTSGTTHVWFVPYEIQLSNGETKKFNLNVRNDNQLRRWYVDGGF